MSSLTPVEPVTENGIVWSVSVEGKTLTNKRGAARLFRSHKAAWRAGWKAQYVIYARQNAELQKMLAEIRSAKSDVTTL